jgi:glycosyltransferase involved in cell wall biosynthesis
MAGGDLRLTVTIDALAELGPVDLFTLYDARRPTPEVPASVSLRRWTVTPHPKYPSQLRWRLRWLLHRGMPMEVARGSVDPVPRQVFTAWRADDYDVIWFHSTMPYVWLGRPHDGPTVVDFYDLEGDKERQRADLLRGSIRGSWSDRARHRVAVAQADRNATAWTACQRSVADEVDRVVLVTAEDVRASGMANAVSVPNTVRRPATPLGHPTGRRPPVLLFQGTLTYAPNADGAAWLVGAIAPKIRARLPGAAVRLVGSPTPGVRRLHRPPDVSVVGVVPTMADELAGADLVVVPLRYGSGSRLKILEAFAHRVPVVSTTVGAEGLGVVSGTHLLIADDPDEFADACLRLVEDAALRRRVVDAAEQHYFDHFESAVARRSIRELVGQLGDGTTRR